MRSIALFAILMLIAGCGSVISEGVRTDVDKSVSIPSVQSSPDQFKGRKVIWGGIIISSENLEDATEIEVLETTLTGRDIPEDGESKGRFIIRTKKFLDTSIYKADKRITVAGIVEGIETRKIGKMNYPYPIVSPLEIKLFEAPPQYYDYGYQSPYYSPYPYGPYGGGYQPFGPFGPYPYPYGPYPYNYPYPYFP